MVIGLVGRGRWGQILERVLKEDKRVDSVLVRGRHWQDLLEETRVSGVVVACSAAAHAEVVEPFLERGIPLFIEKPLALSRQEAERLAEVGAQRPAVPVLVDHTILFSELYQALRVQTREVIAGGRLVGSLYLDWVGRTAREDCSPLWDYGPHALALLIDLFGPTTSFVWERVSGTLDPIARFAVEGSSFGSAGGNVTVGVDPRAAEPLRRLRFWAGRGSDYVTFLLDDAEKRAFIQESYSKPTLDMTEQTPPLTHAVRVFLDAIEGKPDERLGLALAVRVVKALEGIERAGLRR